jgi:DNA-binding NtrC family response regulator
MVRTINGRPHPKRAGGCSSLQFSRWELPYSRRRSRPQSPDIVPAFGDTLNVMNILLILPDRQMVERLSALLQSAGYRCHADRMPEQFASSFKSFKPDLAILDEQLPADEIEAWSRVVTAISPETRLIDISIATPAERRKVVSAHAYIEEPFTDEEFLSTVRRVLAAKETPEPALPKPPDGA